MSSNFHFYELPDVQRIMDMLVGGGLFTGIKFLYDKLKNYTLSQCKPFCVCGAAFSVGTIIMITGFYFAIEKILSLKVYNGFLLIHSYYEIKPIFDEYYLYMAGCVAIGVIGCMVLQFAYYRLQKILPQTLTDS